MGGSEDVDELNRQWGAEAAADKESNEPRLRRVADVHSLDFYSSQTIEYLLDGYLAIGTVNAMTGEPGCGKTTLSTAIASAVERGVPFAGLKTQRRPVLILDRENPISVVKERFERLGIRDSENFKVWGGWAEEEPPLPWSPIVIEWVQDCDPKPLIIVDSLSAFNGTEENSATETRKFMDGFRRLSAMGATIIVLHHSGKADTAKDYRGSSDIKASIDVGLHLSNLGDAARLSTLRLRAFKARFAVTPETIFKYVDGEFIRDVETVSETNVNILRDLLIHNPGINSTAFSRLAAEKGSTRNRTRMFIENSTAAGEIHASKGPNNSQILRWIGTAKQAAQ